MTQSDEELFADYQAGNESAFAELYARYTGSLRRYISQKTRADGLTCDEMVQTVFVRVMKNKDRFASGRKVKPWLYTIADRLCRDHKKVSGRRKRLFVSFDDVTNKSDKPDGAKNPRSQVFEDRMAVGNMQPPDEVMERDELGKKAIRLMQNLPLELRSAVKMMVIRGLPSRAVGPLMQMSHRLSQLRLRMAIDVLRKQLEDDEPCVSSDDIEDLGTVADLLELMPADESRAIERVIFDESTDPADSEVFATLIRRSVGETI